MRRLMLIVMMAGAARAQTNPIPEPLSAWQFFKEIHAPGPAAGLADFTLDREVLDRARPDGEDLRLYDSAGREVPFVLRVRRDQDTTTAFPAREYNRSTDAGAAQVFLDLGEQPQQHNQVEIATAGNNFRRIAEVQGSADGAQWSTLAPAAILFRFAAGGRTVEQDTVDYPISRFRYLRVRVARDPQVDTAAPEITGIRVRRSVQVRGEMTTFPGTSSGREPDRFNGRPVSTWRIDLGGRVPLQRLLLTISESSFSRPFELDSVDDPTAPAPLASGDLARREGSSAAPLQIDFQEHFAQHLKLTVTDDRNPPLSIFGFAAQGAARDVVFPASAVASGTLRLYYGNPKAIAPRYDLAARLPAQADRAATRLALGPQRDNPIYRPEPKPFSERSPWLVYVVLAIAGGVLAAILLSLVGQAASLRRVGNPPADV